MADILRLGEGFIEIAIRLTPKAGKAAIEGASQLADGSRVLLAKVRAAPEKGEANRALLELLADILAVPKSSLTLAAGDKNRLKRVRIAGNPVVLAAKLRRIIG